MTDGPTIEVTDPAAGESMLRGSVRGGIVIVLARGASDAIRFGAMLVLARLLTPEEFGVVGIVLVVVGVASVIQDLGLSTAAVQRPNLTLQQSSTLFWINVALGTVGAVVVFAGADVIASVASDDRVRDVARLLAPTFVLSALGTQHLALLRRQLRFTVLARIRIVSASVYAVVAISLASADVGQNALVWGLVASASVTSIAAFVASPMTPGRPHFDRSTAELTRFGLSFSGFAVLHHLALNLQTVVLGRLDGVAAAGQFGRAQRLADVSTSYLIEPVGGVAFPVMSRLADDPPRWARYYRSCQAVVTMATLGAAPVLVFHADELVEVLLGAPWADSAPVLSILGIGVIARGVCHPTGWIFQSRGDVGRMLRWGFFGWSVVLAGTMIGVRFGIEGAAWGYTAAAVVLVWPCLAYAFAGTPLRVGTVLRSLVPSFAAATVATAVSLLASTAVDGSGATIRLVVAAAAHLVTYGAVLTAMPSQRRFVATLRDQVRR